MILFDAQDNVQDGEPRSLIPGLGAAVNALAEYAPIVVMGDVSREPGLQDLIAAGLLERRQAQGKPPAGPHSHLPEEWEIDFAEVLRHELNNALTGILGNAEMLMALS